MTIITIAKRIRERIHQLQKAYKELCKVEIEDELVKLQKVRITNELDKLQTMLMEIGDIW